jgi:hypothetical protein
MTSAFSIMSGTRGPHCSWIFSLNFLGNRFQGSLVLLSVLYGGFSLLNMPLWPLGIVAINAPGHNDLLDFFFTCTVTPFFVARALYSINGNGPPVLFTAAVSFREFALTIVNVDRIVFALGVMTF